MPVSATGGTRKHSGHPSMLRQILMKANTKIRKGPLTFGFLINEFGTPRKFPKLPFTKVNLNRLICFKLSSKWGSKIMTQFHEVNRRVIVLSLGSGGILTGLSYLLSTTSKPRIKCSALLGRIAHKSWKQQIALIWRIFKVCLGISLRIKEIPGLLWGVWSASSARREMHWAGVAPPLSHPPQRC